MARGQACRSKWHGPESFSGKRKGLNIPERAKPNKQIMEKSFTWKKQKTQKKKKKNLDGPTPETLIKKRRKACLGHFKDSNCGGINPFKRRKQAEAKRARR